MITVTCVLWGNKFSEEYVHKMKSMVKRNTTIDHNFVCFSDRDIEGVDTKLLQPGLNSWWNKMQVFNTKYRLSERIVYLDLDTIITNNIDWLLNYKGKFMGIEDVGAINAHQPHLIDKLQSGVMAWDYSSNGRVWDLFSKNPMATNIFRGDGEYLDSVMFLPDMVQKLYPGRLKSYKYQVYPNKLTNKTSIVCFHGRPSIKNAISSTTKTPSRVYTAQNWIKDYWK